MRRAGPYRGENSGPGKDDRGELDTETRTCGPANTVARAGARHGVLGPRDARHGVLVVGEEEISSGKRARRLELGTVSAPEWDPSDAPTRTPYARARVMGS
jgi:hypothetical protein